MRNLVIVLICCVLISGCAKKAEEQTAAPFVTEVKPAPVEITDPKYVEIGKGIGAGLTSGDIDAMTSNFADNAKYFWSAGDSLVGKQAIIDYWKDRRGKVIETMSYPQSVWLPIKMNEAQGAATAGVWLLVWNQVAVKYKNGKELKFWAHTDYHFDSNDKVDRVIQYIDRAPINAALAAKK